MTSAAISNLNAISSNVSVQKSGLSKGDKTDFGSIMSQSLSTKADSKDTALYTNVSGAKTDKKISDDNTSKTSVSDKPKSNEAVNNKSNNVKETATKDISNEDASKVKEMLEDIKNKIKETLDISDEELENALSVLGLNLQDLLVPANLTELVSYTSGNEGVMALLTDGDLSEKLKGLMNFINESVQAVSEEIGIDENALKDIITNPVNNEKFADVLDENIEEQPAVKEDKDNSANNAKAVVLSQPTDSLESKITLNVFEEKNSSDNMLKDEPKKADNTNVTSNIANNLAQSIDESFAEVMTDNVSEVNAADIVSQIIDNVKVSATEELQSMEIQLNPENLGKLTLTVTAKDGMLTASITAQDEAVKKAIETQLSILKENFNNQGIKVEAVEVTVQSHAFESNPNLQGENKNEEQANQNSRRRLNLDSLMGLSDEELSEEEQRVMNMLTEDGSSVNYKA